MTKFALKEGAFFGWANHHYDTEKDMLYNGRVCETGLAIPITFSNSSLNDSHPLGQCVKIYSVETDQGSFSNEETATCMAVNPGSYCYYYTDENKTS
eukprot:CAMPEP_0202957058 /NCGR_PEP_ID=MMETSP1396-20130829/1496_1 /ASSEMBLY_ACC=CAM_ASM_000872 /TAXON_ID= /ORGANISM="Pseudokeronopsis sp., Strain Brazil" /LENGTH=96 /DNA_ID=CAMNT_0049674351 /DNA_START=602 /DNA_END=892 /DNA_ORIENTATION=-